MPTWSWIVIAAVVVIVLALVAWAFLQRRRSAALQERFGPEYERTVGESDNRRAAESNLLDRTRRRDRLDIKPIPESERARYWEEWRVVQAQFVDEPYGAVGVAEHLLQRVMAARGYPVEDFDDQAELVSVDHPRVVENYRAAHSVYDRSQTRGASTEDLRQALVNYRALFDELLARGGQDDDPGAGRARGERYDNGVGSADRSRNDGGAQ